MRILHAVEFYAPSVGGAQEVVRQVSERLAARGHDVTVATTRLSERSDADIGGVRIAEFDISGNAVRGMSGEVDRYRAFVRDGGFDIVMSYAAQQWTTDALLPVAGDLGVPTVLAPCGFSGLTDPAYRGYFEALPAALAKFDRLVFHSSTYQDIRFARTHDIANCVVIPNGADEREFGRSAEQAREARDRFRRANGIDPSESVLLTVGGHTGMKGHRLLFDVLRRLEEPATLVVVGNTPLGLGCRPRCTIRAFGTRTWRTPRRRALLQNPPRAGVVDAYFAADLFVFGSQVECSPLVLFEAAAAGLPFVTVPAGNAGEIAEWTGGGVVTDAVGRGPLVLGDPAALKEAVHELLDDPSRRRALGTAGQDAWRRAFTWGAITGRYEQLYAELLSAASSEQA